MRKKRKDSRESQAEHRERARKFIGVLLAEDENALEVRFNYSKKLVNMMQQVKLKIEQVRWDGEKKRWIVPLDPEGENLNTFVEFLEELTNYSKYIVYVSGKVIKKLEEAKMKAEEEERRLQLLADIIGDISRRWMPNVFWLSKEDIERLTAVGVFTDQEREFLLSISAWENNFLCCLWKGTPPTKPMPRSLLTESMWETIYELQKKFEEFLKRNPNERKEVVRATIGQIEQLWFRLLFEPRELAEKIARHMLPVGTAVVSSNPLARILKVMNEGIEALIFGKEFREEGEGKKQIEAVSSKESSLEEIYTLSDILKMLGASPEKLAKINKKRKQRGLKPIDVQIGIHEVR